MENEIKVLNNTDIGKISGGTNSQVDIESDKNLYNPKIEGNAKCISCHKQFFYSYPVSDPKSFEKQTFCEKCRLEKVKKIIVGSK